MSLHTTLFIIPTERALPITAAGKAGNTYPSWIIAPEYEGMEPFWFFDDSAHAETQPMAVAIPLPDGRWYYHECDDWSDTTTWRQRVHALRDAYQHGHYEQLVHTKA